MIADFVHEVISACVPPVYPPRSGHGWACIPILPAIQMNIEDRVEFHSIKDTKSCSNYSSIPLGTHLHPLQLNIVKHLAKLSPVWAVLACVFGSSILSNVTDSLASRSSNDAIMNAPDSDRLFYEFAHDQPERFPTLKWWIQMQSNLHRVSESSISAGGEAETVVRSKIKFAVKRCREPESDNESEVDETVVESLPVLANFNADDHRTSEFWHDSPGPENLGLGSTVFLSFDLENEVPYQKAVDKLISEGKLADALALSDCCLNEGASYELLQLLVENGEEKKANFVQHQGYGSQNIVNDSWQYCLRLKDKHLAARLALKYLHKWDLDAAMDILTMCGCHLPQSDPIRDEVEVDCKEDPEGLALRLAGKGAVSAAVEVAEGLQGRQLVKLLTADPLNGGDLRKPHEDRVPVYSTEGQERLPSVSIAEGWVLSGDPIKDDAVRLSHRYESSPDVIPFKALSSKGAIDLCVAQMKNVLSAQQLPLNASMEILGRAYYATEIFVQAKWAPLSPPSKMSGENWVANGEESGRFGHRNLHCKVKERMEAEVGKAMEGLGGLLVAVGGAHRVEDVLGGFTLMALVFAKSQLRKLVGSSDLSINSVKSRDADDSSSFAGSSGINSPYTDELSELLSQSDIWLGRTELLKSLLGSGIVASLDDIADKEYFAHLRDRIIEDERYNMIDSFPVWNAWGHALIRVEHYAQARVKFKYVL
ncbi:hypothetical protein QJS10_CPB14g00985 [Acorus calamus]|uniref:Uncharacterized protein n=1 Tax=Acorus calamus TaxID=4465 RepID=A0AAV9DE57_ACOCL|nr:hypothetical protein QJS10_CPB14g00985 [Acorus calamus]